MELFDKTTDKWYNIYKLKGFVVIKMIYTNFREIDKAGRIVISKDIRNHLNIKPGDILHIESDDNCITIKKAESKCVFCNSENNLTEFEGKYICSSCLDKLSK